MSSERSGWRSFTLFLIAIALIAIAAELGVQTWSAWLDRGASMVKQGADYAITIVGGQVLFGHVDSAGTRAITISNIHYLQTGQPDAEGKREIKLVSQKKADLDAPEFAIVPLDKIILMDTIGADSPVAKAMAQDAGTSNK